MENIQKPSFKVRVYSSYAFFSTERKKKLLMFLNNSSRSVVSIGQSGPDPGNPLELESRSRNVLYGFGKFVLRSSRLLDWDGLFPLAADENIDF